MTGVFFLIELSFIHFSCHTYSESYSDRRRLLQKLPRYEFFMEIMPDFSVAVGVVAGTFPANEPGTLLSMHLMHGSSAGRMS